MSWWKINESGSDPFRDCDRVHTCVEGRYISIIKHRNQLTAIDSTCYHASGPMGQGAVQDIEDLNDSVLACPWHKFMVSLTDGTRCYQAIDMINGKPVLKGWIKGKIVQRVHEVKQDADGIYVKINKNEEVYGSDKDSHDERCVRSYKMYHETPTLKE